MGNTKHMLKHKVALKREAAVTKEMTNKLADDKKISKKEKDERILFKKNEVAEYEATTFSIFYNNSLFLALVIIASFYVLNGTSAHVIPAKHRPLQRAHCSPLDWNPELCLHPGRSHIRVWCERPSEQVIFNE